MRFKDFILHYSNVSNCTLDTSGVQLGLSSPGIAMFYKADLLLPDTPYSIGF